MSEFGKTRGEQMYEAMIMLARIKFWVTVAAVIFAFAVAIKYLVS